MSEEGYNFQIPPFDAWIDAPVENGDKILALSAIGLLSSIMEVKEERAYEYVRAYAATAAKEMGFEVNERRI